MEEIIKPGQGISTWFLIFFKKEQIGLFLKTRDYLMKNA